MSDLDSQELQDLFDTIASQTSIDEAPGIPAGTTAEIGIKLTPEALEEHKKPSNMYEGIGALVRRLHDALREVGQDSLLFKANEMLPQSRERLTFIGELMEKSATQCVQLAEQEMPKLEASIESLKAAKEAWSLVVAGKSTVESFKELAIGTPAALQTAIDVEKQSKAALLDILMAQGFQDLAGQTLGKVMAQAAGLERDLLELLALAAVDHQGKEKISEFLEGPQYKKSADEAVHDQQEVDDLLKDLGF